MTFKEYLELKGIERTEKFDKALVKALDDLMREANNESYHTNEKRGVYCFEMKIIAAERITLENKFDWLLETALKYEKLFIFS